MNEIYLERASALKQLKMIFQSLRKRESSIKSISKIKLESGLEAWLPERELELYREIQPKTRSEVEILSYILEKQMQMTELEYPEWSKLDCRVNPLFIYLWSKDEYKGLAISLDIKEKIEKLIV